MKKRRSIIAIALALVMLSGCESGGTTLSNDSSAVSSESGQYVESSADESSKAENSKAESSDTESSDTESSDTESSKAETSKEESSADNKTSSAESNSGDTKEWKETPTSGTKYVTVDCYSRKNAIIGSDKVDLHTYGSSVKVVAKTDTDYYKLSDGSFIHQDYLSDSKPVKTEPPKTTVKPQTQKPASGSTDKTDGYTWVIQPQYNYDDVEILCDYTASSEYVESEYNPPSDLVGNNYSFGYTFYYPSGETHLVKSRVLNENEDNPYQQYLYTDGKKLNGMFVFSKSGKNGMMDENGKTIIQNKYDYIYSGYYLGAENGDYSYTFDNNCEELDGYEGFYLPVIVNNAYGLNTGKIYECDYIGAMKGLSSLGIGVVVSGNIDTDSLYGDMGHSDVDKSVPGGGKYGLAYNNKLVVPCEYDGCLGDFVVHSAGISIPLSGDNRIVFFKNKKIYVFDKKGKCYSKGVYDKVDNRNQELYYLNGYLPVCKNNKWGLIDVNGKEVLSCQFEDITSVYDGKAWAKQNGKWGVIALN